MPKQPGQPKRRPDVPTRFEVERAVRESDLSPTCKLIMLILATWTDGKTAVIPPDQRKSLTDIAAAASLHRSTVPGALTVLEKGGWVTRRRPPVKQSRRGARTGYRLKIPKGHLVAQDDQLVVSDNHPSRPGEPPLVAVDDKPSSLRRPNSQTQTVEVQTVGGSVGARKRATRLPPDFAVTTAMADWAAGHAPHVSIEYETDKFTDYWNGKPGQGGCKLDWSGTWRNWLRRAEEDAVRKAANGSGPVGRRQAETDAMFDRAMQRAKARDAGPARGELP
jgi:hypothetical protein